MAMGSQQHSPQLHLHHQTLDDPSLLSALHNFCYLLSSCMGPHGRIKTIQNCIGGPLMLTSCSTRLLQSVSFSRPCLCLIVHSIQEHLNNHYDGGLLTGTLCLHLIKNALDIPNVERKYVRKVYEILVNCVNDYIASDACPVRVNVDTSNVSVMLAFIRGIVSTKSVCDLRGVSLQHFCMVILRAFLNSVPDVPKTFFSDRIFVLHFLKSDIMFTEVVEGLLIEFSELSTLHGEQKLNPVFATTAVGNVIKAAVVSISMSGDAEETMNARYEGSMELIQHAADHIVAKMIAFCDSLVERNVGLLLCQKVIHPKVKSYLRQKGIIFVDRIGLQLLAYVLDLTGATAITSVLVSPSEEYIGFLNNANHRIVQNKSYLHLRQTNSFVCTLLLCAAWDEQLAELTSVTKSAVHSLYEVLKKPVLLCGGGCWQIHVASFVRHLVLEKAEEIAHKLHISRAQLMAAAESYAQSFEAVVRILVPDVKDCWVDCENWHLWQDLSDSSSSLQTKCFSCKCGLMVKSDWSALNLQPLIGSGRNIQEHHQLIAGECHRSSRVIGKHSRVENLMLDSLECVMSAIRTAALMACTVLSITQFVHES